MIGGPGVPLAITRSNPSPCRSSASTNTSITWTELSSLTQSSRHSGASLRVLGFTRGEVLRILLLELAILTLIAQPPGWLMGYGLAWVMKTNLAGELMRVRLVVEHSTYVVATSVVVLAAIASAAVIRQRIDNLDVVAVLKTRD
ncbi:putative lysophospholipase L1 biosynthesis ABC-type transport system permease subunit [Bradyrhizobium sp. USDA 336]